MSKTPLAITFMHAVITFHPVRQNSRATQTRHSEMKSAKTRSSEEAIIQRMAMQPTSNTQNSLSGGTLHCLLYLPRVGFRLVSGLY